MSINVKQTIYAISVSFTRACSHRILNETMLLSSLREHYLERTLKCPSPEREFESLELAALVVDSSKLSDFFRMAPITQDKKHNYKELKKAKDERRKWKEKHLIKKLEKQKSKLPHPITSNENLPEPAQAVNKISTVSIAVPGSILENAQSAELRTYLAGQIARAACLFQVDEVVVFDDFADEANAKKSRIEDTNGLTMARRCCVQLGRILQYLECPQYLRKFFFPIHEDLKFAGLLNPLDAPHHLRQQNNFEFREGVVSNKPVKSGRGSLINVGLLQDVQVDKLLTPGLRCTVKLLPAQEGSKKRKGFIISPSTPRKETGVYWGYTVRIANSLSHVFSQSPFKEGYDLMIGTSDKGTPVSDFVSPSSFHHALIMFGGLHGLEAALENDATMKADDPRLLFDYYLNTLPDQGSRTIRTEEAILISLAVIKPKLNYKYKPKEFTQQSEAVEVAVHSSKTLPLLPPQLNDMSRFD